MIEKQPTQKFRLKKGIFIVFEGIDGSGKSTQARLLHEHFEKLGLDSVLTREPTDGKWGRKIRDIAAQGRAGTSLEDEIKYFVEDRKIHVRDVVQPALRRGAVVISDRYFYSTIAYQGALGADVHKLRRLNEKKNRFPIPDIVFFIDISPRTGINRINKKRDGANKGYEREDFLKKVKSIFDSMNDPFFIRIKGAQKQSAIARIIRDETQKLISSHQKS